MVLDLLERFPLFLLVLGLWGPVCPLYAVPPGLTKAQWFNIQHIQISPLQCDIAMRKVNSYIKRCKDQNTFLHDSFQNVATTCTTPAIRCKYGQNNCHQSPKPIKMTHCNSTGGTYPGCTYKDAAHNKLFIIACDPPQRDDPPYPLVPVHFDKIV
ncbi:ribonuclease K6 [Saccopteryx bilineata]|uniref:ribonuclease K6 n=1 Tax=Saccopteryx bilineata TaxID=59482 RepID=UPI00338EA911